VSVAKGGVITAASLLLHGKDSIPPHTNAPTPKTLRNFLSIFQTLPTQKSQLCSRGSRWLLFQLL